MNIDILRTKLNKLKEAAEIIDNESCELKEAFDNSETLIDVEEQLGSINHLGVAIQKDIKSIEEKFKLNEKSQFFVIILNLKTKCKEILSTDDVKIWTDTQFDGCDVGEITVQLVTELCQECSMPLDVLSHNHSEEFKKLGRS